MLKLNARFVFISKIKCFWFVGHCFEVWRSKTKDAVH
jgi:hypothetical protein